MTRIKGDTAFSTSVDIAGKKPLDAKTLVQEKSDLINAQTWQVYNAITGKTVDSFYKGMVVSVANDTEQNNGLYFLKGADPTVIENWEKVGTGDSGVTFAPWQPEVTGTGEPLNFTIIPDFSFGGGYSQNENVFTFSPTEEEDGYLATWKADVENVPEKYSITYNCISTEPNAPVLGYYSGVTIGNFDPDNEIYPTVGFNYMGPDSSDPTLLVVDNYFGDSIVDPAKTLMGPDGYGAITAQMPGQGVDVTLAIDNSDLSASIFYDGVLQGTVYLLEPLIPDSIWVSAYDLASEIGQTATVTLVDRVVEDYIPFTIYGFGANASAIDETKYPENNLGRGYEIVGLAAPAYWNELGKEVKNGDFIVFDNAGIPKTLGEDVDLSDYTQRSEDETITGEWEFQGAMKAGNYTYNTMYGPYRVEKAIAYAHPSLSSPMNIAYGIDTGNIFVSMAVAFNIDDLGLGESITTELFTEEGSIAGGYTTVYSTTTKENGGTVEKRMVIAAYADGGVGTSIFVASRSDGTAYLEFEVGTEPVRGMYANNILTESSGITIKAALENKADKIQVKEIVTANKVLTAADSGKLLIINADGITITLPASTDFNIDIAKMDEDFITIVECAGTDNFREGTATISIIRDVSITNTGIAGKEWLAIGAYEA